MPSSWWLGSLLSGWPIGVNKWMRIQTHVAFGSAFYLLSAGLANLPVSTELLLIASVGAVLPDVDAPESAVGQVTKPVSDKIAKRFGHRCFCHSLLGLLAFSLLILPLHYIASALFLALVLGYLSHLLADSMTKQGVKLLWPADYWAVFPGREDFRIHTGTKAENIFLIFLLVCSLALYPIAKVGFMGELERVIGSIEFSFDDYRGIAGDGKEAWLVGKIQENRTLEITKGKWQIISLYGKGYTLLMSRKGEEAIRIRTVGESPTCNYYPIKSVC